MSIKKYYYIYDVVIFLGLTIIMIIFSINNLLVPNWLLMIFGLIKILNLLCMVDIKGENFEKGFLKENKKNRTKTQKIISKSYGVIATIMIIFILICKLTNLDFLSQNHNAYLLLFCLATLNFYV